MRAVVSTIIGFSILLLLLKYRFKLINQLLAIQLIRKLVTIFLINIPGVRERMFRASSL
ncbi:hypothetical protein GCM10007216_23070 [Thalassobacillus devorans]|uniref:Uncharacterized protein n=1 Tax=Thalassobacillus devorans TaxID=279813 RepID=A0ABQ1P5S0_9BACI|nr:hypothetical protein [Thalassobacillus devorans]NIK29648.1 hypothetical protein [Thalassobacillus devorans]GGC91736.1 hypothetical protein GCM10007216_23070 [Thalassobacillus devorans]